MYLTMCMTWYHFKHEKPKMKEDGLIKQPGLKQQILAMHMLTILSYTNTYSIDITFKVLSYFLLHAVTMK